MTRTLEPRWPLLALATAALLGAPVSAAERRTGEVLKLTLPASTHLPGPPREYTVYVPGQYAPERPAALYVGLDGWQSEIPALFDRLIAARQMPMTIAVLVAPVERSLEHDSPGDLLARFLLEELLPDLEKRQTADGRPLRLSRAAGDRAIGGSGSAAVAAFTAAWERPSDFSRVLAAGGLFVGLRGADRYPTLIRKTEPRPIRVLLPAAPLPGRPTEPVEYAGDVRLGHQSMLAALRYAGHTVHAPPRVSLAEALRWLWQGWPAPVTAGPGRNPTLSEILVPGPEGAWQLVGEGYRFTEGPTVNRQGEVFFNDIPAARTYRVAPGGEVSVHIPDSRKANGQAFSADGRLIAMSGGPGQVLAYSPTSSPATPPTASVIAEGFSGNDLVVAHNGNVYVTSPPDGREPNRPSQLWLVRPDGSKQVVDTGLRYANGVTLSPDQRTLYVDDHRSRWVYRLDVEADGTLRHKRRFCALHVPETADDSSADGMKVDRAGRVYVATRTGLLQICDGEGRVTAVLTTPNRRISNLTFGGPRFDTLVVTSGDRVWKRRLRVQGANAWEAPLASR